MSPPDGGPLPLAALYPWEVADSLWLAANHPGLAAGEAPADTDGDEGEPRSPPPGDRTTTV